MLAGGVVDGVWGGCRYFTEQSQDLEVAAVDLERGRAREAVETAPQRGEHVEKGQRHGRDGGPEMMDWWFPSFRFSKPVLFGVSRVVPCQLGWVSGATTMSRVEMEKMEDGVLVECSAFSVSHEASDQGGRCRPHP